MVDTGIYFFRYWYFGFFDSLLNVDTPCCANLWVAGFTPNAFKESRQYWGATILLSRRDAKGNFTADKDAVKRYATGRTPDTSCNTIYEKGWTTGAHTPYDV